jgi:hypothetical protein
MQHQNSNRSKTHLDRSLPHQLRKVRLRISTGCRHPDFSDHKARPSSIELCVTWSSLYCNSSWPSTSGRLPVYMQASPRLRVLLAMVDIEPWMPNHHANECSEIQSGRPHLFVPNQLRLRWTAAIQPLRHSVSMTCSWRCVECPRRTCCRSSYLSLDEYLFHPLPSQPIACRRAPHIARTKIA